jgi:hypothetical protein
MEKTMYIEWLDGMVHLRFISKKAEVEYCIEKLKSMYGNSVATLIYFRLFKNHLIEVMDITQSLTAPCMFYKADKDGKVALIAVCHIDDNAIAGTIEWIQWFKTRIRKRFAITKLGRLKKHLGIWYDWKTDEKGE